MSVDLSAIQTDSGSSRPPRIAARAHPVENWIVLAVMITSTVVAWMHIRSTSIWYDEAITLPITSGHEILDLSFGVQQFKPSANLLKILFDLYRYDVHPPLYFWTLAIWRVLFGGSLEVARALSTLFALGTLLLLYRYAIEVGIRWPCVPVVIYALSAAGLRYAYNARPYAMATFLIVLTLYLAHRKSKWTGICAVASVATHYFAALCVGPILAIECLMSWKTDRHWILWTACSFAALCAPLTLLVTKHEGARPHQYPGFGIFREELFILLNSALRGAMPGFSHQWRLALLVPALFIIVGWIWAIRHKLCTVPFAYAAFLSGFLFMSIVTNKSIIKMPSIYYLGIGAPLLALLVAYGVNALPYASPVLASLLIAGTVTTPPRMMVMPPDYRTMLGHIRAECNHCVVLAGSGYGVVPACTMYEAKGLEVFVLRKGDTPGEVVQRIGTGRIIYLIPSNEPPTMQVEKEFVQSFPSEPGDGYFKIDTTHRKTE